MKKFESFLKQLKYYAKNSAITAQTFKDAATATGDVSDIIPNILSLAQEMYGIPATELPELAELSAEIQAHKRRQEKIDNLSYLGNKFTELAEKSPAMEAGEFKKALADLLAEATDLAAPSASDTRNRFSTYAGLLDKLKKDAPEKDFTSSLLVNLRCPNGTMTIIAARPAGGKTSMLINLAREALDTERNVFFVNLEMNELQIFRNICLSVMYSLAKEDKRESELSGITETIIQFNRSFRYAKETAPYPKNAVFAEYQKRAMEKVGNAIGNKLFIYDGIGTSLESITADIIRHAKEGDIVLLDYIQRAPAPTKYAREQRYIQIAQASRELLSMAITAQCVLISGAQLAREAEKEKREARQSDLRESGDIENDAHNILAIEPKDDAPAYIHVLKAREGGGIDRMALNAVRNYICWEGIGKYTPPKKDDTEKKPSKKSNTGADYGLGQ
jgi:hypothetical protein